THPLFTRCVAGTKPRPRAVAHAKASLYPAPASCVHNVPSERSRTMNRGSDSPAGTRNRIAALFAPRSASSSSHRPGLIRRTLLVTAIGLFAGAAALGMVQQPDRTELPPQRQVQSVLSLEPTDVSIRDTDSAAP